VIKAKSPALIVVLHPQRTLISEGCISLNEATFRPILYIAFWGSRTSTLFVIDSFVITDTKHILILRSLVGDGITYTKPSSRAQMYSCTLRDIADAQLLCNMFFYEPGYKLEIRQL
jgi:hypothetical protein